MQDDHPYDMVDTETTSFIRSSYTIQGLVQNQTKYYYGERGLHIIGGIPSSYTLFFLHPRNYYTLSHIPQVTQDGGNTTIIILVELLLSQSSPQ